MIPTKIPTKVQRRSGFDKSHHNAFSQKVGTITPILVDEVIPNSKVYLRYAMAGSMPPMATDTYMKCYYDVRAFFVPFRLLFGGFESFMSDYPYNTVQYTSSGNVIQSSKSDSLPYVALDPGMSFTNIVGQGTLLDYLGYKDDATGYASLDTDIVLSLMPLLAYHRIYNDFFRQPNIQREVFARPGEYPNYTPAAGINNKYGVAMLPYLAPSGAACVINTTLGETYQADPFLLADGVSIFSLRQANYDYDYFTNALPSAQLGSPMSVNTAGGSFTISQLRAMNSLQQFSELNMLAGANLVDVVKARYGANLSRGVAQRCLYLGGDRIDIATKSVDVTVDSNVGYSQNPFINKPGATGGRVYVQGTDIIIDDFTADEPGYVFVVGCVIPKVTYGSGVRKYLRHYIGSGSITDMANPLLQNVGNQPIYQYELTSSLGVSAEEVKIFGYTDRYGEFMTMEDEVHSLLRYGESLASFIAQRYWTALDNPVIGSNFLEIPTNALDNITATTSALSNFGFYGQFAFDYKVSQPLAQYSLPSLQNPAYEHGKTVVVHRGGFRF